VTEIAAASSQRLLAIASRPSEFFEMAQLSQRLAALGAHVTLLYLHAKSEPALHADIVNRIQRDGRADRLEMIAIDFDQVREGQRRSRVSRLLEMATPAFVGAWVSLLRDLPAGLWPGAATTLRRALSTTALFQRCIEFYDSIIRERRITAVLIPEDVVGPFWPTAIKASHRNGIPSLVFPYTLADRQEALQSLKTDPGFQTSANAIGAHLFPAWRWKGDGFDLVRLPEDQILAHERLDISPPDPWMMNSGFADLICVDSEASRAFFGAGGIPAGRMRVVGSASQDEMFTRLQQRESYRARLDDEHGLAASKPLLLVSGCPNQLEATVPYCEFSTMEEVARAVGESLAPLSAQFNLLVRPHPNYAKFGDLLRPFGFSVSAAATAELVPVADLFTAFASATIRWAIACGVPTVNYDVFHYGYSDFAAVPGVVSVSTYQEFRQITSQLSSAHDVARLKQQIMTASPQWALMDGRSVNRIQVEIEQARARHAGN
jgi:hypothetical protein